MTDAYTFDIIENKTDQVDTTHEVLVYVLLYAFIFYLKKVIGFLGVYNEKKNGNKVKKINTIFRILRKIIMSKITCKSKSIN